VPGNEKGEAKSSFRQLVGKGGPGEAFLLKGMKRKGEISTKQTTGEKKKKKGDTGLDPLPLPESEPAANSKQRMEMPCTGRREERRQLRVIYELRGEKKKSARTGRHRQITVLSLILEEWK